MKTKIWEMVSDAKVIAIGGQFYYQTGRTLDSWLIMNILKWSLWFIIGMFLEVINIKRMFKKRHCYIVGVFIAVFVLILSWWVHIDGLVNAKTQLFTGILAVMSTVCIVGYLFEENSQKKVCAFFAEYTMPIFLLHTIFAAPARILLLKFDMTNLWMHMIVGIGISFVGPIIAAKIMGKMKWLDVLIYPTKYIK